MKLNIMTTLALINIKLIRLSPSSPNSQEQQIRMREKTSGSTNRKFLELNPKLVNMSTATLSTLTVKLEP